MTDKKIEATTGILREYKYPNFDEFNAAFMVANAFVNDANESTGATVINLTVDEPNLSFTLTVSGIDFHSIVKECKDKRLISIHKIFTLFEMLTTVMPVLGVDPMMLISKKKEYCNKKI